MKRPRTLLPFLLVGSAFAFPVTLSRLALADEDGPPVVVERGESLMLLNGVLQDLDEVQREAGEMGEEHGEHGDHEREHGERGERWERHERMMQEMRQIRDRVAHLRDELAVAPIARGEMPPPLPPPPPAPRVMDPVQYQQAMVALAQAQYTPRKFEVMSDMSRLNWFTVDQVIGLMNQLYWANDRVRFAGMCYPHTVDKDGWGRVYAALQAEGDRDQLHRLVGDAYHRALP